jgi:hypothetical protein
MNVVEPSAAQAVAVPTPPAPAGAAGTASTPFLIMQQQQRDSALSKRQHSGVLGSFFAVSSVFTLQCIFNACRGWWRHVGALFPSYYNIVHIVMWCLVLFCPPLLLQKTAAPASKKVKTAETAPAVEGNGAEKKVTFNASSVRFKFNQGFSNAVKRPVLMDEFL